MSSQRRTGRAAGAAGLEFVSCVAASDNSGINTAKAAFQQKFAACLDEMRSARSNSISISTIVARTSDRVAAAAVPAATGLHCLANMFDEDGADAEGARPMRSRSPELIKLEIEACGAVSTMICNGAIFRIRRRRRLGGGRGDWLYELPKGGDRERCRQIVRDAKDRGGAFWREFIGTIFEIAGGQR